MAYQQDRNDPHVPPLEDRVAGNRVPPARPVVGDGSNSALWLIAGGVIVALVALVWFFSRPAVDTPTLTDPAPATVIENNIQTAPADAAPVAPPSETAPVTPSADPAVPAPAPAD
ncbi:MAG: hypothetical protein ACK4KW_01720 [Gemmobacter sp.]